jgi:NH3-dependent NAD+ synthetase
MIDRGFLFNPDYEVRSQIRMIGGMPDLFQFDHVFISCSGGKDSQAMSYLIAELAEKQGYPKENIELLYADTGFEWHDTFEHVKKIGEYLGIKAVQVLPKFKLLDNVRRRWIKFNGLEEQNRTEQNRTEQNNGDLPSGKTEAVQVHFRTKLKDSVQATTSELRSSSMSVPITKYNVVQKSRKTVSNRAVYQELQGGGR